MTRLPIILAGFCLGCSTLAWAADNNIVIDMYLTSKEGIGKNIGTVTATDTAKGLLLTPKLHSLPPQAHGFHVHAKPSCEDEGKAAGDHFDPKNTEKHEGPKGHGHLGDLPVLVVDKDGTASQPVLAPHLSVKDLKDHALMIHESGDNYSDNPKKAGGGGARIACGVVK